MTSKLKSLSSISKIFMSPVIDEETAPFVMFKPLIHLSLAAAASLTSVAINGVAADAKPAVMADNISVTEVKAAQDGWCEALLAISKAHNDGGIAKSKPLAGEIIDAAYGYQFGPVAFKPTWANGDTTFRETRSGALSYFVGEDPAFGDPGFAIGTPGDNRSPWVKCVPEIFVIQSFGNTANAMGWVHLEAADGTTSKVDKTFGYLRDDNGALRIVVHHSSSPFTGY